MKFILFAIITFATPSLALSLRVTVPAKNPIHPFKDISGLTYCTLASKHSKLTPLKRIPSRDWQLSLDSFIFSNGNPISQDDLLSSLSQANLLNRSIIENFNLKKSVLTVRFRIPISNPLLFLDWPIMSPKPSSFCGPWKSKSGNLNELTLVNGRHTINFRFDNQKDGLQNLANGLVDIYIPETWSEIDQYLRKNPQIRVLTTKKPQKFYLNLNPNRGITLQSRLGIIENLKKMEPQFPLTKADHIKSDKPVTIEKVDSIITAAIALPEHIKVLKEALLNLQSQISSTTIRIPDEPTLEYEIRSGQLDGWISTSNHPWLAYHSKLKNENFGKAGWSSPAMDGLIQRNLAANREIETEEIFRVLESEGLLLEIAQSNKLALIGKSIQSSMIEAPEGNGKFIEALLP